MAVVPPTHCERSTRRTAAPDAAAPSAAAIPAAPEPTTITDGAPRTGPGYVRASYHSADGPPPRLPDVDRTRHRGIVGHRHRVGDRARPTRTRRHPGGPARGPAPGPRRRAAPGARSAHRGGG